jgi:hypothetical protein
VNPELPIGGRGEGDWGRGAKISIDVRVSTCIILVA